MAARRRRRRSIDLAARRRRRRGIDLAAGRRRWRSATIGAVRDGTPGEREVGGSGVGRKDGGSDCESSGGYDGDPAEFQHHDTSPVIHFLGGEPALAVCQLKRQRRHELEFPSGYLAISRDMVNLFRSQERFTDWSALRLKRIK